MAIIVLECSELRPKCNQAESHGSVHTHQVTVPWLSRVALQTQCPQTLHQQRNHSMVAGADRGDRGDRGGRQGGDREWRGRKRRRREGRATPVCRRRRGEGPMAGVSSSSLHLRAR